MYFYRIEDVEFIYDSNLFDGRALFFFLALNSRATMKILVKFTSLLEQRNSSATRGRRKRGDSAIVLRSPGIKNRNRWRKEGNPWIILIDGLPPLGGANRSFNFPQRSDDPRSARPRSSKCLLTRILIISWGKSKFLLLSLVSSILVLSEVSGQRRRSFPRVQQSARRFVLSYKVSIKSNSKLN